MADVKTEVETVDPNALAQANARIAGLQYIFDVVKGQLEDEKKDHLQLLRKAHLETGSKSWVARGGGEELATITLSFLAESFEVLDLDALTEWAKEFAPELVSVEEVAEIVIPAKVVVSIDEGALKKGATAKGGKIFFEGAEVPAGLVKHKPGGKTAKAQSITKKKPEALSRFVAGMLGTLEVFTPAEIEPAPEAPAVDPEDVEDAVVVESVTVPAGVEIPW